MAKSPSSSKRAVPNFLTGVIGAFTGRYSDKQLEPYTKNLYAPKTQLQSDSEREKMLQLSQMSQTQNAPTQIDPLQYFGALSRKSILNTLDNERIIQMAPEISLAASVMVPSILAPNDMREGTIQFECREESLSAPQKIKISKIVTDFCEDYFHLSTALPKWIEEAMYRSGAKPLMVLPLSTLYGEMTEKDNFIETASVEKFNQKVDSMASESVFGFADSPSIGKTKMSFESFGLEFDGAILANADDQVLKSQQSRKTKKQAAFESLVDSVTSDKSLAIVDNPDAVGAATIRNRSGKNSLQKKINIRYKEAEYIAIKGPTDRDAVTGHPMFMQIPAESVIPIFTPGTPEDHIGYFIVMDEYGHPINAMEQKNNGLFGNPATSASMNSNQTTFYNLFQAYGFTQNSMYDQLPERQVMEGIYQQIIENHLKSRADNAGFANVGLGSNSSLYRAMFTRYLEQRKTKLLFVPKDFLIYFCFKHSQYGTGVSKLEDLKWILSLRISLLVARMLSAFKNSIDRKLIEINFDGQYPGNALQHARTAQREAINKDLIVFSYDPTNMAQQIVERSYSVKLSGIPGIPNYSVVRDTDNRSQSSPPDRELSDDIKNMEYLGLEVPPAVLNNLNDAEFSRSVATTNIVFSRKLVVYQMVVCHYMNQFVRTFIRFSAVLRKDIADVIKSTTENGSDSKTADSGTVVDNKTNSNRKLLDIVDNIFMVLPSPTMAPNDAQFDTLTKMANSFNSLIDLYMADDIAGDNAELKTALMSLRAMVKSQLVQSYAKRIGIGDDDFPDLADSYSSDTILKVRQALFNLSKGLSKQADAIDPNGGDDGSSGGGDFSGGGTGSSFSDSSDSGTDKGNSLFGASTSDDNIDNFGDTATDSDTSTTTEETTNSSGGTTDTTTTTYDDGGDQQIPEGPDGGSLV